MKKTYFYIALFALALLTSCGVSEPQDAQPLTQEAPLLPDNAGATLPPNIAPLNFQIETEADDYVVTLKAGEKSMTLSGPTVDIDVDEWHQMLDAAKGDTLHTRIYIKKEGQWYVYPEILNPIAPDEADPYISYRVIHPGYIEYEDITIRQRNITNWDEDIVYDNREFATEDGQHGQCVNCHNYQDYNRQGRMQMHLREVSAGTLITEGGNVMKVNLKTDSTLSAGAYPAWHPTLPLIVYSCNATGQAFHTSNDQKVEVIDYGSDLIMYDISENKVYSIEDPGPSHALGKTGRTPDDYETFPAWSPDGKMLYFSMAHHHQRGTSIDVDLNHAYDSLRYDIYCRPFDVQSHRFGPVTEVVDASSQHKSAVLPRISPDGRYLLYSQGDFGNFHIWHRSADLAMLDLKTGESIDMSALNSDDTDSYHSWSSNGRWILFSSRRVDGSYTRLYMAYFDRQGHVHRPVLLPQQDPTYYQQLFRSYNIPEWMCAPVAPSQQQLKAAARGNAKQAEYGGCAVKK